MTQLYVLAQEYRAVANTLADMDLDEQTIADTLESMSGELETKATNVAMFARNLEVTAAAIKAAAEQMTTRGKAIERRVENLRQYLLDNMIYAHVTKIDTPYIRLGVKTNPPSVSIFEESLVPNEFMRQPDAPPLAPDKTAIKAAIAAGNHVPGCRLIQTQRLDIK